MWLYVVMLHSGGMRPVLVMYGGRESGVRDLTLDSVVILELLIHVMTRVIECSTSVRPVLVVRMSEMTHTSVKTHVPSLDLAAVPVLTLSISTVPSQASVSLPTLGVISLLTVLMERMKRTV